MENYSGKDERRADDHAERLVKLEVSLEAGMKSVGRSIDGLRDTVEKHISDSKICNTKLDAIESEFDTLKGGYKVFLKMCGFFAAFGAVVWAIATWVAGQNGGGS